MNWFKEFIQTKDGQREAIAPYIISASRSTDIPAFYAEWFVNRLKAGYVKWINPFNQTPQYVSLNKAQIIVFWSKNPKPLMQYLHEIDNRHISYYFQFTINDYENERFEPKVPPLKDRIQTFKDLSAMIGKERVIWRFDPLILTEYLDIETLLHKIEYVGEQLHPFTQKLVTSFADISIYSKVQRNLKSANINYKEFQPSDIEQIASGIEHLNRQWGLQVSTCAEKIDLSHFGIRHSKCIDDSLIIKMNPGDKELLSFLGYIPENQLDIFSQGNQKNRTLKDKGQRYECGCIISKDIGQYNTCAHLCIYCYANYSPKSVAQNRKKVSPDSETIVAN